MQQHAAPETSTQAAEAKTTPASQPSQVAQPKYQVGDIVRMKKKHPCGSFTWEILRTGMDFRLKCTGCWHVIMLERKKFEKMSRGMVEHS